MSNKRRNDELDKHLTKGKHLAQGKRTKVEINKDKSTIGHTEAFGVLPEELIYHIFNFFTGKASLHSIAQVCKRFGDIVKGSTWNVSSDWKKHSYRYIRTKEIICKTEDVTPRMLSYVKKLEIRDGQKNIETFLESLCRSVHQITDLTIGYTEYVLNNNVEKPRCILGGVQTLNIVSVRPLLSTLVRLIYPIMPQLSELNLNFSNCSQEIIMTPTNALKQFYSSILKSLSIKIIGQNSLPGFTQSSVGLISTVIEKFRMLESLDVSLLYPIDIYEPLNITSNVLKSLSIRGVKTNCLPLLKHLTVDFCDVKMESKNFLETTPFTVDMKLYENITSLTVLNGRVGTISKLYLPRLETLVYYGDINKSDFESMIRIECLKLYLKGRDAIVYTEALKKIKLKSNVEIYKLSDLWRHDLDY